MKRKKIPMKTESSSYNILNLYAGIGGNRVLWPDNVNVTAVERESEIAKAYKDKFPKDIVIVGDAHEYLLKHYLDFDFIWSSPPCPSHGQFRYLMWVKSHEDMGVYPDMKLYEEIIFLQYHAKCKWVVENTVSYYEPLIKPQKISRHYFWANFGIVSSNKFISGVIRGKNRKKYMLYLKSIFDTSVNKSKISNKTQVYNNCVNPELGAYILKQAMSTKNILDYKVNRDVEK